MDKVAAVAWREFLATVRTRAFLLSVVLMPGLIIGALYGADLVHELSREEKIPPRKLAVVDRTGRLLAALAEQVASHNRERPSQPFELEALPPEQADTEALGARARAGELYGYLLLAEDALEPGGGASVLGRRDNQLESGRQLESMINEAVFAVRCAAEGIDPAGIAALRQPIALERVDAKTGGAVSGNELARVLTPFVFMFLLFMGTFSISMGLLTTLIEEKSSRVVEVLLSALSPTQLLAGKIVGMALVGFALIVVWGAVGMFAAHSYRLTDLVTGYRLAIALVYFVPGFLLFAAILAAIGSACNELKEAQSMSFPLSLLTIVPLMFWFYLTEHPASAVSVVLSYVPPITPLVMVLRVCADPDTPVWQIVTSLAALWGGVGAAIWAAGKIFRVGVLMYGKPPSLRELLRWVRCA